MCEKVIKEKQKNLKTHLNDFIRKPALLLVFFLIILSLLFSSPQQICAITLKELGNSVAKLARDEESLIEEIIASETEVENKRRKVESLNEELVILGEELAMLDKTRKELAESIENKKEALKEKIVFSYKYSNDDVTKIVTSAGDLNEVLNNLYLLKNIMEGLADNIEELRFEKEEYQRISRKSEEKRKEVENMRDTVKKEEEELLKSIEDNKVLLEKVKGEKDEVQSLLNEIKRRIAMIQPPGLTLIGEWDMLATAYYAFGKGGNDINGNGITAIGLRARKGIIAVDPRVIPLGTRIYIPGYGEALAADTGGWIKGNRIDLCFETYEECFRWGKRRIKIYLIED